MGAAVRERIRDRGGDGSADEDRDRSVRRLSSAYVSSVGLIK